jgi:molybdopterin/thiamine biosynthesis adenylyltransferase
VAPCSEAGILGAVAGVMGTLQAVEVVKELLGLGDSLVGRLLLYDALQTRFTILDYAWDSENPLNGESPRYSDLSHHRVTMAPAGE